MNKVILTATLICLFAAPLAFAQSPGNSANASTRVQRRVNLMSTVLSLTNTQQQQATTIFTNETNTNAPVFANLKAARQALEIAIENNDGGVIDQESSTIGNLVGKLAENASTAYASFYQMLNPDQQAKARQLHADMRGTDMRGLAGGF
jgi:Spy/CpxP family protein refolding chaperone